MNLDDSRLNNFVNKKSAFQGDLSVVTIENLMQLVSHAGLSGELCLAAPDNDACFVIRKGALVFGHVEFNFPRIGERLVQEGYISAKNLQECLHSYQDQSRNGKHRLGELLINNNYILDTHLEEVVKDQIKDSFFHVLSWDQGTFTFSVNETPHNENIHLDERIDHLIIEGIVNMDHNS